MFRAPTWITSAASASASAFAASVSSVTTAEFFAHYARMLGRRPVRTAPSALLRPLIRLTPGLHPDSLIFMQRRAVYPNERARRLLGWEPRVTLEDGMRRTERWLREVGALT